MNYPVIVIPGIMGSRLFTSTSEFTPDTVAWDPQNLPKGLLLMNARFSPESHLYPRPCENQNIDLTTETAGNSVATFGREYGAQLQYKPLVDELCREFDPHDPEKYRPVYFFGYDWRNSNTVTAEILDREVRHILSETGAPKVDIVCHSMGGIVTSKYYALHKEDGAVNRIISLGTPFEGAPKLLNSVLNWDVLELGANPLKKKTWVDVALGFIGGMRTDLKASFDGAAELCPSERYLRYFPMRKEQYNKVRKSTRKLPPEEYDGILASLFGKERVENLKAFQRSLLSADGKHNVLYDYDKACFVYGAGFETICAVRFDHRKVDVDKLLFEDRMKIRRTGDRVVPWYSATMMGQVEKLPEDRRKAFATDHHELTKKQEVIDFVIEKLKED